MTKDSRTDNLGSVYTAKGTDEVAALYDRWSATYEDEMKVAGYRHPSVCLAMLTRHLPKGAAPLLDAGAGTGLIGEWLPILGYPNVEALDISEGMLAIARTKGIYSAFHKLSLGGALPFADGTYAGVVSTGVFTTGHVGAEALDELVRITAPGGILALTVKDTVWADGFEAVITAMAAAGRVALAEATAPYVSMPGEAGTTPGRCVAIRVL